ncbi:MAG: type II secretion system protein [Planctomycetota bacterium]
MIFVSPPPPRRHGFTLVETALATVLVGGLFVVAMNLVGASRVTQSRFAERDQALLLAENLLQEILAQPYEEPDDTGVAFGLEVGETLALRVDLNDADDYHGYSESPPVDANGNAVPGATAFTRSVQVHWVELDAPETVSPSETGLKRVVVTVRRGGRATVTLRGYVTANWPDARDMEDFAP